LKACVSVDPDSELIDEVIVTPANTPDRDAVPGLVESLPKDDPPEIVGDAAYGDGATRAELKEAGLSVVARVPPVRNATGGFPKDRFAIDLESNTVTCPAKQTVPIRSQRSGGGVNFASHCSTCPLAARCTRSRSGRTITIHRGGTRPTRSGKRDTAPTARWSSASSRTSSFGPGEVDEHGSEDFAG
jgi:hypothetical protein